MLSVEELQSLFDENAIFISKSTQKEDVIKGISDKLLKMGFVKEKFLENVLAREKDYPTGIDLSVVDPELPNIAIPHTEAEFVNVRKVIPVHLDNEIEFNNMIDPDQKMKVRFLFMILNDDPEGQSNILAQIMNFVTTTPPNDLKTFFKSTDTGAIYNFLSKKFN